VLAVVGGAVYVGLAGSADQPPTIRVLQRNLANALAESRTTVILRVDKQRTRTPHHVTAVEWVDLATGRSRVRWYDASGRVQSDTSRFYSGGEPSGACGCDLDPFTNFPTTARVALLGRETIGRQPTFHLRFTISGGPLSSTTDIWIDRSTYLPVREKLVVPETSFNKRLTYTVTDDFTWLPRTRANLAHLAGG
jgi:hypothetical protein